MALISVVIPVYNAALTLPATIRALQAQSWTRWEAFIVDDGSLDESLAVAQALADKDDRLQVVVNPGKGPSAARNHAAIDLARGDIVSFCDADDIWTPNKLEDVANVILGSDVDAVFGRVAFFSGDPTSIGSRSTVPLGPLTVPMLLAENPVCTVSNLSIRRGLFSDMEGLREDMSHNEDLEFLVDLVGIGAWVEGIMADHVLYRLSSTGLSADLEAMRESRIEVLRTALRYGYKADAQADARYLRYLARRALRLDLDHGQVRALVVEGVATHPKSFLFPLRRGAPTALGGLICPLLPRALRRFLFSR